MAINKWISLRSVRQILDPHPHDCINSGEYSSEIYVIIWNNIQTPNDLFREWDWSIDWGLSSEQ